MYLIYFPVYRCTNDCPWCLQLVRKDIRSDKNYSDVKKVIKWLKLHKDITGNLALSGGECTIHPDFKLLIESVHKDFKVTVTTNLNSGLYANMDKFIPWALKYPIRYNTSFHPGETLSIDVYISRVKKMKQVGISIGQVASVDSNALTIDIIRKLLNANIGWRLQYATGIGRYKDGFIADPNGELLPKTSSHIRSWLPMQWADYDKYVDNYDEYKEACGHGDYSDVECSSNRIIIGPDDNIYTCHSNAYFLRKNVSLGHVDNVIIKRGDVEPTIKCPFYGSCEFSDFGHFKINKCKI